MRRGLLLLGASGVVGFLGCAPWRQPVPTVSADRAPAATTAAVVIPLQANPQPAAALPPTRATAAGEPAPVVQASATVAPPDRGPAAEPPPDALTLVAEALDRGDNTAAAGHLAGYLRQHPEQDMFRLQLAELLVQMGKDAAARAHFEKFLINAETSKGPVRDYLVHVHTRLMEIAERGDDHFGELLHRGAGLLVLVREQDKSPDRDDGFSEEMLCKALRALNDARDLKPDDPRLRNDLAELYQRMGNPRAARNERAAARNTALPGELTPAERADILLK